MYERFFGLSDAPFRLTPDPRYLFLSRRHADALAHLRLGLEESGFVCLTGDVGTGKTTLLRAFLGQLGPEIAAAYVFNPALSALELLKTVSAEFGLPAASASPKKLIDGLNAHLLAQREAGRRCVVVIDEAQALGIDVLEQLRLLSNLETTTEKLLRIVLVGQPQLRALLLHPELVQLNQRITLRWHIGPLGRAETAAYVRHRLAVAGDGQAGRIFTRGALALVHRRSGGVPRLVNMLCHRAMVAGFAADRRTIGRRLVRRAYREIATVPLPAPRSAARRAAWTALGAGVCLGALALAARQLAPTLLGAPDAREEAAPPGPALASAADPAPAPPPADVAPAFGERVAALDSAASARAALGDVLAAWRATPLAADEAVASADDFAAAAARRTLDDLPLSGNLSMLRLLDLPAVLELQAPGSGGPRWMALLGVDGDTLRLGAAGTPVHASVGELERVWFGRAYVFWRDFDGLGPVGVFVPDAKGDAVRRLQGLLRRAGAYAGPDSGVFEQATADAVRDFQRSRLLVADGVVGPLTRIALYGAVGGYPRPALAGESGGAS
ncbi:MAG TPA: AAA family ATPase [Candidatus Binatia bacterium]|nr:AAA family ATPase [Candidatus Binatia bacterium]